MSSGSGPGNPFGLAAVCAVCLPLVFYVRLYCPIPPIANIIFFLTTFIVCCSFILVACYEKVLTSRQCQVIGYSYQNQMLVASVAHGLGWDLAWVRLSKALFYVPF